MYIKGVKFHIMNHQGKRLFITGIPTSGKSYLAKVLAEQVGGTAVSLDDLRESLSTDESFRKWATFYLDTDEKTYLTTVSAEEQWNNLVAQSEGLWPSFLCEIANYELEPRPVIFECVNILPHLAKADLDFSGVVLIGTSYEETLARNIKDPRWGGTLELQELEAKTFFYVERPYYKKEAEKFEYPVFEKADDAFDYCLRLVNGF